VPRDEGLQQAVAEVIAGFPCSPPEVAGGADFYAIEAALERLQPELVIGHSKGQRMARQLDVPLLRVGFPIHDRFGGQRLHHLGYRGTQELFDRIVNLLLERKQLSSPIGYGYL